MAHSLGRRGIVATRICHSRRACCSAARALPAALYQVGAVAARKGGLPAAGPLYAVASWPPLLQSLPHSTKACCVSPCTQDRSCCSVGRSMHGSICAPFAPCPFPPMRDARSRPKASARMLSGPAPAQPRPSSGVLWPPGQLCSRGAVHTPHLVRAADRQP